MSDINTFARRMISNLDKILCEDRYKDKLKAMARDANDIDYGVREALVGTLESLANRALRFSRKFKKEEIKKAKKPEAPGAEHKTVIPLPSWNRHDDNKY